MVIRDRKAWLARFYHEGKLVTWTKRSFGSGKINGQVRHLIRQQLKLNEKEFDGVIDCTLERQDYVSILRRKGYID